MNSIDQRSPSPLDSASHGPWSLWDMLELKAGAFVAASSELAALASFISGTTIGGKEDDVFHEEKVLVDDDRTWLKPRLTALHDHLKALGADITMLCVTDAEEVSDRKWVQWRTVKECLEQVTNTLKRELSLKVVLVLQPHEAGYFAPRRPLFGPDFAVKFTPEAPSSSTKPASALPWGAQRPASSI
jgi:hypothetical protein